MDATKPGVLTEAGTPALVRPQPSEVTALVERAKGGDAEAFADLMSLYERRIIGIGIRVGLSREDALDACQDAFVRVFRFIHKFRSGESFYRWLYRVALNVIQDYLRKSRQPGRVSLEEVGLETQGGLPRVPTPQEELESDDLQRRLLESVKRLSPRERIVFVLRDMQGMSTAEIGRYLRLSEVTVRRHCMSARLKLRDLLFLQSD